MKPCRAIHQLERGYTITLKKTKQRRKGERVTKTHMHDESGHVCLKRAEYHEEKKEQEPKPGV